MTTHELAKLLLELDNRPIIGAETYKAPVIASAWVGSDEGEFCQLETAGMHCRACSYPTAHFRKCHRCGAANKPPQRVVVYTIG